MPALPADQWAVLLREGSVEADKSVRDPTGRGGQERPRSHGRYLLQRLLHLCYIVLNTQRSTQDTMINTHWEVFEGQQFGRRAGKEPRVTLNSRHVFYLNMLA